jgi:phage shock protein A
MRLFVRTWNVVHGLLSRLVSIFERRNPEALLEREQERFRDLISQFNQGLVTHATLAERLKSVVSANELKAAQTMTKVQALLRAGDSKAAGRHALELQQLEAALTSDHKKLDEAEAKYRYLVEARDTAVRETKTRMEQLRWQIGDLKVNRAMADLENMAAAMVGGITDPGDGLNRLQELVIEENDKAKASARVANANFTATDYTARESEQDALAAQALADIVSREFEPAPLALPDFSEVPMPTVPMKRH